MYVLKDITADRFELENEYNLEQLIDIARNYKLDIYSEKEAIQVLKEQNIEVWTIG